MDDLNDREGVDVWRKKHAWLDKCPILSYLVERLEEDTYFTYEITIKDAISLFQHYSLTPGQEEAFLQVLMVFGEHEENLRLSKDLENIKLQLGGIEDSVQGFSSAYYDLKTQ